MIRHGAASARTSLPLRGGPGRGWRRTTVILLSVFLFSSAAPAQPSADRDRQASRYADDSLEAFNKGDYVNAEALLRKQLELQPDNFVVYYNLACARSMQHDGEGAADLLSKAIEKGFCDIYHLKRDPTIAAARATRKYKDIIDHWPALLDARLDANLKATEKIFKNGYTTERDDQLRLVYRSAVDAHGLDTARQELTRLSAFADEQVIPGILDPERMKSDAWVVVVLPTRPDFMRWAVRVYGQAAIQTTSMIGGSYEHDQKQLVSMDLGATLRHEFFHVLHWRSCTRLGQLHPIWVMEGLCSLVEDYDLDDQGRVKPTTSWRTNMAKRMLRTSAFLPIETMASMPQSRFTGSRPLGNYAEARAFFLFLYQSGKLKDWYAHFTSHFSEDPSGVKSLEAVFEKDIKRIDSDFRAWLRALPDVPEQLKRGMASLGIDVDAGSGEGPVVAELPAHSGTLGDLRLGDVITAIDGRATRDLAELVRVLSTCKPGQQVEVEYRRGKLHRTTTVTLVAMQ